MKVLIHGSTGRMGKILCDLLTAGYPGLELAARVSPEETLDAANCVYTALNEVACDVECVIDFSHHTAVGGLMDFCIAKNLPVAYKDESHISFGDLIHGCSGPRTHVNGTGKIEGFRLYPELVHDKQNERWLMIGFVGENSQAAMDKLRATIEASERNAFNDMFAF